MLFGSFSSYSAMVFDIQMWFWLHTEQVNQVFSSFGKVVAFFLFSSATLLFIDFPSISLLQIIANKINAIQNMKCSASRGFYYDHFVVTLGHA